VRSPIEESRIGTVSRPLGSSSDPPPWAFCRAEELVTTFQIQENKFMRFRLGVILLLIFPGASFGQSNAAVLSSPDGRLTITFRILSPSQLLQGREVAPIPEPPPGSGQLIYEVSLSRQPTDSTASASSRPQESGPSRRECADRECHCHHDRRDVSPCRRQS
jgi:hypothetical protein